MVRPCYHVRQLLSMVKLSATMWQLPCLHATSTCAPAPLHIISRSPYLGAQVKKRQQRRTLW